MRNHASNRGQRAVRFVLALALTAAFIPAPVTAEQTVPVYSYWYTYAQTKVYPTTTSLAATLSSDTPPPMALAAAQSEFEGRQVAIRPVSGTLRDIWIQPSNLEMTDASGSVSAIPAANVSVFKVWYVNVTHPSYPFKVKGLQPDPLLPMTLANGERLGWKPGGAAPNLGLRGVSAGKTQPFYVLFKVPAGSEPGTYTGSLKVTCSDEAGNPAPDVEIPVSLTVYPFSVAQRTLKTAFAIDAFRVQQRNSASGKWLGRNPWPGPGATRVAERTANHTDQMNGWLTYMSDHRLSPQLTSPAWSSNAGNGTMTANRDALDDYLSAGQATTFDGERFAFNTVKMPDYYPPSFVKNPFTSSSATARAARYYKTMKSGLGAYSSKAYIYPVDEPKASQRRFVERYATWVHRVVPGVKYLLTTDPVTQNSKLVKGVDIYVNRLPFVFRDTGWTSKIRKAKKQLWIYSHRTNWEGIVPMYLIDKPLADSRVQAWMAYKAHATGLLYYNVNAWRVANGSKPRDPYTNPVSGIGLAASKPQYCNGDGTLVYPGYYPALGLYVEGAPPVGSLRTEALRDGLEDYEYVRLVGARYGAKTADAYAARIIGPVPKPASGKLRFPKYQSAPSAYESVRVDMAAALSQP